MVHWPIGERQEHHRRGEKGAGRRTFDFRGRRRRFGPQYEQRTERREAGGGERPRRDEQREQRAKRRDGDHRGLARPRDDEKDEREEGDDGTHHAELDGPHPEWGGRTTRRGGWGVWRGRGSVGRQS